MPLSRQYDAVVIGAGPNGLAAAVRLAGAGRSVLLLEGKENTGGGLRSAELTLPGFVHDICSAVHPLAKLSPYFSRLPLENFSLKWIRSPVALAHPLEGRPPVLLTDSMEETAGLLEEDAPAYRKLITPLLNRWDSLLPDLLAPLHLPRHPFALLNFSRYGLQSAAGLVRRHFSGPRAGALFAGLAAHSMLPLDRPLTAAVALVLGISAHRAGWPFPQGGAQKLAVALGDYFTSLGGEVQTGRLVQSMQDLPPAGAYLFDVLPRDLLRIAGERFSAGYRRQLQKYRHGPGVFKMDFALSEPVPFRFPECGKAATLHLGGEMAEIAEAEAAVWQGKHPARPFVLLVQPSLFDGSRAPGGKQTAWAYCHVPAGSEIDCTGTVERQIERFAPGFRDCILEKQVMTARDIAASNPNYAGGDISGGVQDWRQLFFRPAVRLNPYSTPDGKIFICSSATPPGAGVHGMCGFYAAETVLHRHPR